jgi:hypothetical protein
VTARRIVPALFAALLALALSIPAGASAATVTNTNDAGAGSLRQAIADATPGETIVLPAGDYAIAATLAIAKSLTIEGAGAAQTKIHPSATGYRNIKVGGATSAVTISGVTISGALSPEEGGGILNDAAQLTLREDTIAENVVNKSGPAGGGIGYGGGVMSKSSSNPPTQSLTIVRCRFFADRVDAHGGGEGTHGGIAEGGGVAVHGGALLIDESSFEGNAVDATGGAGAPDPEQHGGIASGGGISIVGLDSPSAIRRSTFLENAAISREGAGATSGGAEGAGIAAQSTPSSLALENLTVTGNRAILGANGGYAAGGGVVLLAGQNTVTGSTLVANSLQAATPNAESGGGNIAASSNTVVSDSIVARGGGPAGKENCTHLSGNNTFLLSGGFNIEDANGCKFNEPGDKVNTDPKLGPLKDNGGPTQTMEPEAGSPAIDQGRTFGLTTDQRGLPRPVDVPTVTNSAVPGADLADIGAVEVQPGPATPAPTVTAFTLGKLTRNTRNGTGRIAVTLTNPTPGGRLVVTGAGLRAGHAGAAAANASLPLAPVGAGLKRLGRTGRVKLTLHVSLLRVDGSTAQTATRTVTLIKVAKKHRGRRHRPAHPKAPR